MYKVMKSVGEGHVVINSDNIFGSVSSSPTATIQNPNVKFTSFDNPNCSYVIPVCSSFKNPTFSSHLSFSSQKFTKVDKFIFGDLEGREWNEEHDQMRVG